MVGGRPEVTFAVPLETIKEAAITCLKAGRSVWFGCCVQRYFNVDYGVLAPEAFDYESLLHMPIGMSKADELTTMISMPTHAMAIVGVDLDINNKPIKWRIENSWGVWDDEEDQGYLQMSDAWFDKYVYEVLVPQDSLSESVQELYTKYEFDPIILPYIDPVGTCARQVAHDKATLMLKSKARHGLQKKDDHRLKE